MWKQGTRHFTTKTSDQDCGNERINHYYQLYHHYATYVQVEGTCIYNQVCIQQNSCSLSSFGKPELLFFTNFSKVKTRTQGGDT